MDSHKYASLDTGGGLSPKAHRAMARPRLLIWRHVRKLLEMKNLLTANVLFLLVNLFFLVMQCRQGLWPVETYFQPTMSDNDRVILMRTVRDFSQILDQNNITYFMYGGTLIGSYRHHGPIPWDDDVDFIVNGTQKDKLRQVLDSLRPQYDVYVPTGVSTVAGPQWKFYGNALSRIIHAPFKWPYIDIFFFAENSTHLWDDHPHFSKSYRYDKKDVFPLVRRPFGELMLPGPCETHKVLQQNYNIALCRSKQFNHAMELPMFSFQTKDVICERLKNYFPFVYRSYMEGSVNETLMLGEWTLNTITLPSKCKGQEQ